MAKGRSLGKVRESEFWVRNLWLLRSGEKVKKARCELPKVLKNPRTSQRETLPKKVHTKKRLTLFTERQRIIRLKSFKKTELSRYDANRRLVENSTIDDGILDVACATLRVRIVDRANFALCPNGPGSNTSKKGKVNGRDVQGEEERVWEGRD